MIDLHLIIFSFSAFSFSAHSCIGSVGGSVCVGSEASSIVLRCDSVLGFEGQVFGKPAGPGEAIERWQRMAGRCGSLLTGHCLMRRGQPDVLACVETVVRFAPLSQVEIEAYVASGEPLQCAGGFALEGRGGLCIDGLEGCYSNVIGLSLPWLRTVLELQQVS